MDQLHRRIGDASGHVGCGNGSGSASLCTDHAIICSAAKHADAAFVERLRSGARHKCRIRKSTGRYETCGKEFVSTLISGAYYAVKNAGGCRRWIASSRRSSKTGEVGSKAHRGK